MDGILVINKPSGMTSHDVIIRLRRILREKKIGHTGTLDPDATGILVACIGKATKIIQFLDDSEKIYHGTMTFGIKTDTMDAKGSVLGILDSDKITQDDVIKTFNTFLDDIYQIPPMVSAIKIGGERLYNLARQGKIVDREPRKVHIFEFDLTRFYQERNPIFDSDRIFSKADFIVRCSRGTYVRVLAHDIGEKLGCGAILSELTRIKSGIFTIDDSVSLDELNSSPDLAFSMLKSIDYALSFISSISVNNSGKLRFLNGMQINESDVLFHEGNKFSDGFIRVYDENRLFLGIGKIIKNELQTPNYKPVKVLFS